MPRIGRPPQTEATLRARITAYCARYGVSELNDEGFPAYPAGFRETPRHREWMALYKAFGRVRARIRSEKGLPARAGDGRCPVCLQGSTGQDRTHRRCAGVIKFLRELGPSGMDRIRAQAFPDDVGPVTDVRPSSKRKV
jgi:hypothetical protein